MTLWKVRELEAELEQEQRRSKESLGASKRFERQWREVIAMLEEEKRLTVELHDLLDKTQIKLKQ